MKPSFVTFVFLAAAGCATGDTASQDDTRGNLGGKADSILSGSCATADDSFCGGQSAETCWCDDECADFHDCCADAGPACGVESNRLPDRTAGLPAETSAAQLEVVASLPYPP